jgi:hypothetical protein
MDKITIPSPDLSSEDVVQALRDARKAHRARSTAPGLARAA